MLLEYEMLDRVLLPACTRNSNSDVAHLISIIDLKGISMTDLMSTTLLELVKWSIKLFQDYYPERILRCFIINTPMLFSGFWTLVSPLLNKRTQAAITVCSGSGLQEMMGYLGAQNTPREFGGQSPIGLDHVDRGMYLVEANAALAYKKWEVTPYEAAAMKGNSHLYTIFGS